MTAALRKPVWSVVDYCTLTAPCAFSQVPLAAQAGRLRLHGCLQGLLHSMFQYSEQTYFVCHDCARAKTLAAAQPGCVFTLTLNTTMKLEGAMEEYFMARRLDYEVQCAATTKKESGVECRRMCRLPATLIVNLGRVNKVGPGAVQLLNIQP